MLLLDWGCIFTIHETISWRHCMPRLSRVISSQQEPVQMPNKNKVAHCNLSLISFVSWVSLMHLIPATAAANRRLRVLPRLARGPAAAPDGRPRRLPPAPEGGPEPPRVQPRGPGYELYRYVLDLTRSPTPLYLHSFNFNSNWFSTILGN